MRVLNLVFWYKLYDYHICNLLDFYEEDLQLSLLCVSERSSDLVFGFHFTLQVNATFEAVETCQDHRTYVSDMLT
jgi:hypothetical protein